MIVAAALTVAGSLAACSAGGGSAASASGGSATSGNITWWGWTPSVQYAASYIAAFNKAYPNIHVTFKQITIAGYDAAMRPALAAPGVGPDVFDIAPGAGMALYAVDAVNLEPEIAKALGPGWKSRVAPAGRTSAPSSSRTGSAASCKERDRSRSTRTLSKRFLTASSPVYGPRCPRGRSRGPARRWSKR